MILGALTFKEYGAISPLVQILVIVVLLVITVLIQRREYRETGVTFGRYPWRVSTFLSSIYEEIIFRGIILFGLLSILSAGWSIVVSSILFGLWHLKNYKWQTGTQTLLQVLYAGCVFGPIASVVTLWMGSIWPVVAVHYLHNIVVNEARKVVVSRKNSRRL